MAGNPEIYKKVRSLLIPGYTFENVQGVSAMPKNTPFKDGHTPFLSLVSVNGNMDSDQGIFQDRLVRISPIHGRSYEIRFGQAGNVYWSDEYGNVYSTLTTKGNNLNYPKVFKNDVSPSGFLVYGLQDSDSMVRILRGSELLRSNNVETEIILKVIEPQQLPIGEQLVSVADFKRNLIHQVWEENVDKDSIDQQVELKKVTREDIPALSSVLDKMTFFITVRGHQVSERIQDLTQPETKGEFVGIMQRVFSYVNKIEEIKSRKDSSYTPDLFDAEKDEDIEKYLTEYLSYKLAVNFAKLHNLELVHFFPHSGNISAVGSIYDLDSIRGEILGIGDNPVTEEDIKRDINYLIDGQADSSGVTGVLDLLQQKGFINKEKDLKTNFKHNFYKEYVAKRGWDTDILGNLGKIYSFFDKFATSEFRDNMMAYYLSKISQQIGWDYPYPEDITKIKEAYEQHIIDSRRRRFQEIKEGITAEQKRVESVERFKNDNNSKIQSHRNGDAVFKALEKDLRGKFGIELKRVTETYGQEITDIIVTMHILRHHTRMSEELRAVWSEEAKDGNEFYLKTIKEEGWEDDIFLHLGEIYDVFENFSKTGDEKYLEYYLALLNEQTGIKFHFDNQDVETVVDAYIGRCREDLERILGEVIKEMSPVDNAETVILKAYVEAGYSQNADFSWDQWTVFVPEFVSWIIEERIGTKIEEYLVSQFDKIDDQDNARGDIYAILTARAEKKLEAALNDDKIKEILQRENQMELAVMARYIADPQLAFSQDVSEES